MSMKPTCPNIKKKKRKNKTDSEQEENKEEGTVFFINTCPRGEFEIPEFFSFDLGTHFTELKKIFQDPAAPIQTAWVQVSHLLWLWNGEEAR